MAFSVPEVLLSGHHENVALFRLENSLRRTKEVRPDLFDSYANRVKNGDIKLTKREMEIFDRVKG